MGCHFGCDRLKKSIIWFIYFSPLDFFWGKHIIFLSIDAFKKSAQELEKIMILCPNCYAEITDATTHFCMNCKKALPLIKGCKKCHKDISFNFNYCPHCGANNQDILPPEKLEELNRIASEANKVSSEFTDPRDSRTYKTVIIGNQEWMAENLAFVVEGANPYNNSSEKATTYGLLYTWEQAKLAVPEGFRLPTREDFVELENFCQKSTGLQAGTALKSNTEHWCETGMLGTRIPGQDSFGFKALPAGSQSSLKVFNYLNNYAYFWTDEEKDQEKAYFRHLSYYNETFAELSSNKNCKFSVRAIKIK